MFMEARGQAAELSSVGKKGAGWDGTPWSAGCEPKAIQGCEEPPGGRGELALLGGGRVAEGLWGAGGAALL